MAILMRGGPYEDFDPSKLRPREWAVVLENDPSARDGKAIYICFAAGMVKRISTYEDMKDDLLSATDDVKMQYILAFNEIKEDIEKIKTETEEYKNISQTKASESQTYSDAAGESTKTATEKANAALNSAENAAASANDSEAHSNLSKSYAIGTNGEIRPEDEIDNSRYYKEECQRLMWEIEQLLWSIEGGGVTGVKGDKEIAYRVGNVNLTAKEIGAVEENDFVPNSKTKNGYVSKGEGNPNKIWGTDAEGNPMWMNAPALEGGPAQLVAMDCLKQTSQEYVLDFSCYQAMNGGDSRALGYMFDEIPENRNLLKSGGKLEAGLYVLTLWHWVSNLFNNGTIPDGTMGINTNVETAVDVGWSGGYGFSANGTDNGAGLVVERGNVTDSPLITCARYVKSVLVNVSQECKALYDISKLKITMPHISNITEESDERLTVLVTTQVAGLYRLEASGLETGGSGAVEIMKGATANANGAAGLVPAPMAGQENCVLFGDGSWKAVPMGGGTALSDVSDVQATSQSGGVAITWKDPKDVVFNDEIIASFGGTKVVRKVGEKPTSDTDGTLIANSTVRDAHVITPLIDAGATKGEDLNYALFPYTTDGIVTKSDYNRVNIIYNPITYDPVFANNTWEQIAEAIRTGEAKELWPVGSGKFATINKTGTGYDSTVLVPSTMLFRVIGYDYVEKDGSISNATFCADQILRYKGTAPASGNTLYDTNIFKKALLNFKDILPEEIRKEIKTVNKFFEGHNYDSSFDVDVFPLSSNELGIESIVADPGTPYPYFSGNDKRIKKYNDVAYAYLTRTTDGTTALAKWRAVSTSGAMATATATSTTSYFSVPVAFVI